MFLGWREMRNSPGRYLGIVALITLITYLVFFLTGLAYGLAQANRSAIDRFDARGMIISSYANGSLAASRISIDALDGTDGADNEQVQPLIITPAVVTARDANGNDKSDEQFSVSLFGFDQESFLKPNLIEGRAVTAAGEAVVAESMVKAEDVAIGDVLHIEQTDADIKIVGISEDGKYSVGPVAYVTLDEAAAARPGATPAGTNPAQQAGAAVGGADTSGAAATDTASTQTAPRTPSDNQNPIQMAKGAPMMVSAFVLQPGAPANLDKIHDDADHDSVEYMSIGDVIWGLPGYAAQVYTFAMMIGFLVVICAIVIGIFMYILTIQKKPVFGVLKAQGIPGRYIALAVLAQTAIVAAVGIILGFVLTVLTALPLPSAVPYQANYLFYAVVGVVIFMVAGIGAQVSVRQVTKIDPLEAMS